jgi:hypothetical protein
VDPTQFNSTNQSLPAVAGSNTAGGTGVVGLGHTGVLGESRDFVGVSGLSHDPNNAGVMGVNDKGGWGVTGRSSTNTGVSGESVSGVGVHGTGHTGVFGESQDFVGVSGLSHDPNNAGVMGVNDKGGWGVTGRSSTNTGVSGESVSGVGVHGKGGRLAGFFEGSVQIVGDLQLHGNVKVDQGFDIMLTGADCAEQFDIASAAVVPPGTVLVIGRNGALEESSLPYDRKVAGVVSGAGRFRPGIVLDKQDSDSPRQPIALIGKVYCKVDADLAPIEVGDLLTTSSTPGHAMKAVDPSRTLGALLGKALSPLADGQGLIPILVALQ